MHKNLHKFTKHSQNNPYYTRQSKCLCKPYQRFNSTRQEFYHWVAKFLQKTDSLDEERGLKKLKKK